MLFNQPKVLLFSYCLLTSQHWLYLFFALFFGAILFYLWIKWAKSEECLELQELTDDDLGFDDLAPVNNAEQSDSYLKGLKWALANLRVRNIAITGPYGSGKSSILQTFKNTYPNDYKYLNISLASFKEDEVLINAKKELEKKTNSQDDEESQGEKKLADALQRKNEAHQLIELSILQQIFYKVTDSQISDSRFKRIQPLTIERQRLIVSTTIISVLAAIWLLLPEAVKKLPFMEKFSEGSPTFFLVLPLVVLLPGTVWLLFYLVRFIKDSGFKKLKISSGEIEINPKSEGSILNKYLDELIYFFFSHCL